MSNQTRKGLLFLGLVAGTSAAYGTGCLAIAGVEYVEAGIQCITQPLPPSRTEDSPRPLMNKAAEQVNEGVKPLFGGIMGLALTAAVWGSGSRKHIHQTQP